MGVTRHEKKKCAMHCDKRTSGFFAWIGRLEEPEFKLLRNTRQKSVILNIERFLSYLTFYPPKKVALPFIKNSEKNTLVCLRSFDSLRTKKKFFFVPSIVEVQIYSLLFVFSSSFLI
jgi:hypothetical protein